MGEKASIGFLNGRIHAFPHSRKQEKEVILINCVLSQSIALYTRMYIKHRITFLVRPKPYMGEKARLSSHRNESDLFNCYRIRKRTGIFLGYDTTFFSILFFTKPDGTGKKTRLGTEANRKRKDIRFSEINSALL